MTMALANWYIHFDDFGPMHTTVWASVKEGRQFSINILGNKSSKALRDTLVQ